MRRSDHPSTLRLVPSSKHITHTNDRPHSFPAARGAHSVGRPWQLVVYIFVGLQRESSSQGRNSLEGSAMPKWGLSVLSPGWWGVAI